MSYSKVALATVVSAIAFVGFGDRVLPSSVGQYSQNSRAFLLDMLPSIRAQNRNAAAEDAIQELEQR